MPSVTRDRVQSHGGAGTASVVRQHLRNALLMFILQKVAPSHFAQQSMLALGTHLAK